MGEPRKGQSRKKVEGFRGYFREMVMYLCTYTQELMLPGTAWTAFLVTAIACNQACRDVLVERLFELHKEGEAAVAHAKPDVYHIKTVGYIAAALAEARQGREQGEEEQHRRGGVSIKQT